MSHYKPVIPNAGRNLSSLFASRRSIPAHGTAIISSAPNSHYDRSVNRLDRYWLPPKIWAYNSFDNSRGRKSHLFPFLRIGLCLLAVLYAGPQVFGQNNGLPKQPLKARIVLNQKEFHLGEPIELTLEISNTGHESFLIANSVSLLGNADAFLEIELRSKMGQLSPRVSMVVDCFPAPAKEKRSPTEIALNSFLLLRPGTSFVQRIPLYEHLRASQYDLKAGKYTLQAYYSSNGLLYPSSCGTQGISEEDVKSLPFRPWNGKVGTNEVSFTILPLAKPH